MTLYCIIKNTVKINYWQQHYCNRIKFVALALPERNESFSVSPPTTHEQ